MQRTGPFANTVFTCEAAGRFTYRPARREAADKFSSKGGFASNRQFIRFAARRYVAYQLDFAALAVPLSYPRYAGRISCRAVRNRRVLPPDGSTSLR